VLAAIDTVWDVVDLYSDVRDCLGDSDSMACYMAAAGVAFIAMGALEGPSNNVAREAARAADVEDAAGDVARTIDPRVRAYADAVTSSRPWSWAEDIPCGADLSAKQRAAIKRSAIDEGLIPDVSLKPGTKYVSVQMVTSLSIPRNGDRRTAKKLAYCML
jgi:hypothetical protein